MSNLLNGSGYSLNVDPDSLAGALQQYGIDPSQLGASQSGTNAAQPQRGDMTNTEQVGLGADLFGPLLPRSGLGADISGPRSITQAPAAAGDDGANPIQAQPSPPAVGTNPPRLTDANVQLLGRVLTSECGGVCSSQEVQAVGSTFINRMNARKTDNAADVLGRKRQFATNKAPTPDMLSTAYKLLSGQLGDNTGGAMNFYSPRSMPMEGQPTGGSDVSGGLEYVPGFKRQTTLKNYRPGFTNTLKQHIIPGVSDWHLKVYGPP